MGHLLFSLFRLPTNQVCYVVPHEFMEAHRATRRRVWCSFCLLYAFCIFMISRRRAFHHGSMIDFTVIFHKFVVFCRNGCLFRFNERRISFTVHVIDIVSNQSVQSTNVKCSVKIVNDIFENDVQHP